MVRYRFRVLLAGYRPRRCDLQHVRSLYLAALFVVRSRVPHALIVAFWPGSGTRSVPFARTSSHAAHVIMWPAIDGIATIQRYCVFSRCVSAAIQPLSGGSLKWTLKCSSRHRLALVRFLSPSSYIHIRRCSSGTLGSRPTRQSMRRFGTTMKCDKFALGSQTMMPSQVREAYCACVNRSMTTPRPIDSLPRKSIRTLTSWTGSSV